MKTKLMWKRLTIVEIIGAIIEWILFGIDFIVSDHFNTSCFIMAILFTLFSILFFIKYKQEND